MVLPDNAVSGRFVNVSPAVVGISLEPENLKLEAGKTLSRTARVGEEQPFQVLLPDSSGNSNACTPASSFKIPASAGWYSIYQSDGIAHRLPLKVIVKREPAPAPQNM